MTAKRLNTVKEYYFSSKLREVSLLKKSGKPIINLGIGSPDLQPSGSVVKSLLESLGDSTAHQYQSYQGIPELRKAISSFYNTHYNVKLNSDEQILPLIGSKEGIMHISMAFLNPGDKVLIPNPGYPTYSSVTKLLDAEPIPYELNESKGWLPDLEKLEKSDMSKVKLMWLNYPHMPTGSEANDKFYKKIILFAKKNNILLINDNPYSFILTKKPKSFLSHEGAMDVGMELNSLSKSFNMAGWRVGMLLGNSSNIKSVLKVKSNIDSGMFYGIQKGAITALNQSTEWFTNLNKVYNDRRKIAWKIADKLNATYNKNSVGLFVWARIQENIDNVDLLVDELLYKKNIFITPGKVFGSKGNRYIRISLCTKQIFLNEALNRL
ncbi:MAG: aminotransferase [Flavobacteriales bacterium]|nr:aminotransferase [Flavobacteriales bacterium]